MAEARITIVVSCYNNRPELELAFESYRGQTMLPRVIVADDGSADGTLEWLDGLDEMAYPFDFAYVTQEHRGYRLVSVNNLAVSHVTTSRILFTNADVLHNPKSVEGHASLDAETIGGGAIRGIAVKGAEVVTAKMIANFAVLEEHAHRYAAALSNEAHMQKKARSACLGIWGGNMSFPAKAFRKAGGFSEDYCGRYGGEEIELIKRMLQAEAKVRWVRESVGYHLGHKSRAYRAKAKERQ